MEYFVSKASTSSNSNNGLTRETAFATIQKGVDVAVAGDTVLVLPGTYREMVTQTANGTAENPIKIIGMFAGPNRPIIKGSDVVTGWTRHTGNIWKASHNGATLAPYGQARQIFYNDTNNISAGKLIYKNTMPTEAGTFWSDDANYTVYVWMPNDESPNNHFMEVSLRPRWLFVLGSYVHVSKLIMRHTSSTGYYVLNGISMAGTYGLLEGCDMSWADASCCSGSGSHSVIRGNRMSCSGVTSLGGGGYTPGHPEVGHYLLFEDNLVEHANLSGWEPGWHCSNKFGQLYYSTFRRNIFRHNQGPGLWLDSSHFNTIEENISYANSAGSGFLDEIGKGNTWRNNVAVHNLEYCLDMWVTNGDGDYQPDEEVDKYNTSTTGYWATGAKGIILSSCEDAVVEHNTLVGNRADGICVEGPPRNTHLFADTDYTIKTCRNTVRSNVMLFNSQAQINFSLNDGTDYFDNVSDYNLMVALGSRISPSFDDLADYRAGTTSQPGGSYEVHSIEGQAVFRAIMEFDYRLEGDNLGVASGHDGLDMGVTISHNNLPYDR